jgi:hypothetical protein
MGYKFITCDQCSSRFRVKKFNKPYVGKYEGKPVFHHHYNCVECGYVYTVRLWNEFVNPYFDKVIGLEFSMIFNRKDKVKYRELLCEYEIAEKELDDIVSKVKQELGER